MPRATRERSSAWYCNQSLICESGYNLTILENGMNTLWTNRNFRRLIAWSSFAVHNQARGTRRFFIPLALARFKKMTNQLVLPAVRNRFGNWVLHSCERVFVHIFASYSSQRKYDEGSTISRRLDYERTSFPPLFPRIFSLLPSARAWHLARRTRCRTKNQRHW